MGGLAAAAENRGPVKKKKEKNSSVKLKASDYVGLPKKKRNTAVKLKASDYVGLPNNTIKLCQSDEQDSAAHQALTELLVQNLYVSMYWFHTRDA